MTTPCWTRRCRSATRSAALRSITGGAPVYPLVVLFGLNAVDELDRTAFGILVPEIRDDFGLDLQGVLTLIAFVSLCALLAAGADRRCSPTGTTGSAIAWIGAARVGRCSASAPASPPASSSWPSCGPAPGIGKAVVDPTHNSLIADYYEPIVRPRVFSAHRAANAVGAVHRAAHRRPAGRGVRLAAPFFVFAAPTLVFVVLALAAAAAGAGRPRAPGHGRVRGGHRHRGGPAVLRRGLAAGLEDRDAPADLVLAAVPRRVAHRVRLAGRPALRARSSTSTSAPVASCAASTEPVQLVGLIIGARVGDPAPRRGPRARSSASCRQ